MGKEKENLNESQNTALNTAYVVCSYSSFPQSLKAGKKYRILAKHKDRVAVIDDTKELVIYNKCYFDLP